MPGPTHTYLSRLLYQYQNHHTGRPAVRASIVTGTYIMTTRIGFGYDVHAFAADRPLILGGVAIPFSLGLAGHSDADTVIHAIVDALLGAAALGDIGTHFTSHDPRWKDQPSSIFLDYTRALLAQHGWQISNIDSTIVAERPRLAPHIEAMRTHIAAHLHLS